MSQQRLTDSRLANLGANAICKAFDAYHTPFKTITQRAKAALRTGTGTACRPMRLKDWTSTRRSWIKLWLTFVSCWPIGSVKNWSGPA